MKTRKLHNVTREMMAIARADARLLMHLSEQLESYMLDSICIQKLPPTKEEREFKKMLEKKIIQESIEAMIRTKRQENNKAGSDQ